MRARKVRRRPKKAAPVDPVTALYRSLPFAAKERRHDNRGWWAVPANGVYSGGCDAGTAAAWAYMKLLREKARLGQREWNGGLLQHIALDMLVGRKETQGLRGQAVGFFSTLDFVMNNAVRLMGELDRYTFEGLGDLIQKGCAKTADDDKAEMRERKRVYMSKAAKSGWARRRKAGAK